MISTTYISDIVAISVIGAVAFSILHAKDVSAAASLANTATASNVQPLRTVENPIHLDFHTHVDRQNLGSLLQNVQQDRPLASTRHIKKTHHSVYKKNIHLGDSMLGYHLPHLAYS